LATKQPKVVDQQQEAGAWPSTFTCVFHPGRSYDCVMLGIF